VADPHRLIAPGSAIDGEARRRGTTLYLSGGLQPMLPLELGAGPLSLSSGRRRAAVSLALSLDADGGLRQARLVRSWIRVAYGLSYADADELIELAPPEDPDLARLDEVLRTRRQWRARAGALTMEQAEGRIRRGPSGPELQITEPGPARSLVAEAMILAGAAAADWATAAGVAMPYRCQDGHGSLSPEQLLALPEGPVRWAQQRIGLARSRLQASPGPHRSLGLAGYLQWTSPIRRYGDLLAHRQWLAAIGDLPQPPLSADALLPELEQVDRLAREAQLVAREDQRLALLQWLESRPPSGPVPGLLLRWLRQDQGLGLVRIDDWGMDLAAEVDAGLAPGDGLLLVVSGVSSRHDRLELRARRR
jgi:exoribonuclease-2